MQDHFGTLLLQGVKAGHLTHEPEQLNLWMALAGMSAIGCRFNRSMQHPLILPDAEVRIWRGMHGRVSCRSRRLSQERQRLDATVFPGEQISSVSLRRT